MKFAGILALLVLGSFSRPALAVVSDTTGTLTYQQNPPTETDVPHWNSGWPAAGITGWDYIGRLNGTSGVYLGDGWVLTAAHVGSGPFILNEVTYNPVAKSQKPIIDTNGTTDLIMFQVAPAPPLPALPLGSEPPLVDDSVVMIGFGGDHGKTWGLNKISRTDTGVRSGQAFKTIDFFVSSAGENKTRLVAGDSGGGTFTYNGATGQWELAGINHAVSRTEGSCIAQLNQYAVQINFIRFAGWNEIMRIALLIFILLVALVLVWQIARARRPR